MNKYRGKPNRPLTNKQQLFISEYMVDMNATQAAIRAGYKPKNAHINCVDLMANTRIKAEIEKRLGKIHQKLEITAERVLRELALLGFANMQDYMRVGGDGDPYLDFSALTRDQAAALAEVTVEDFKDGRGDGARDVRRVKFKLASKIDALDKIGRHLGIFKDRIEHTGKDGGPIQTEDVNAAREALSRRIAGIAARNRAGS